VPQELVEKPEACFALWSFSTINLYFTILLVGEYSVYYFLCQLSSPRTPKFRKTVMIPTPRTPTPFKNALAAQEKMHGPLKMEVRRQMCLCAFEPFHSLDDNMFLFCTLYGDLMISWFYLSVCLCVSATAVGIPRRRHSGSFEAGDRVRHL